MGISWSWNFAVPSCHPNTFIDLANTFLANKRSLKTICTVSGSESTHKDVTGQMYFEKIGPYFVKTCFRAFAAPSCHPSTFMDIAKIALANNHYVKTICMNSESDNIHMVVTSPVNSKQQGRFFWGNHGPGFLRSLVATRTTILTL